MESELRQLQLKCLEILDIVVKICTEHNIKYSLCGGSVVGAHLYKGFLPWDDDIDIMMTRENYNQFLVIAEKCLPEPYTIIRKGDNKMRKLIYVGTKGNATIEVTSFNEKKELEAQGFTFTEKMIEIHNYTIDKEEIAKRQNAIREKKNKRV